MYVKHDFIIIFLFILLIKRLLYLFVSFFFSNTRIFNIGSVLFDRVKLMIIKALLTSATG